MEGWIKSQYSGAPEDLLNVLRMLYDEEWDEEDQGLREL